MQRYSLSHLADADLDRELDAHVASDRSSTADLLAHLAEFDFAAGGGRPGDTDPATSAHAHRQRGCPGAHRAGPGIA